VVEECGVLEPETYHALVDVHTHGAGQASVARDETERAERMRPACPS
jgi:hypothetical protein